MEEGNILIVDDDKDVLLSAELFLSQYFSHTSTTHDPTEIIAKMKASRIDVVLLDMNFQKGENEGDDGFNYLKLILEHQPETVVIFMTAYGDIDLAVRALKEGAIDFITKPWKNEKLLTTVDTAIKLAQAKKHVDLLKTVNDSKDADANKDLNNFLGESLPFLRLKETIQKVAPTEAGLLLLGDNGTGKGLAARYVHNESLRKDQPFISVDLGAISETLLESELFGHEKGAFTDAKSTKAGRFELAHGGTLFLDEIGNLSLPSQAKLLTVLQNKEVRRLGSNQEKKIDIRLICATNMPLYDMVKDGSFRQDLLYRINTVEIKMPGLSERIDDLPVLLDRFVNHFKRKYNKPSVRCSSALLKQLQSYPWPGNIRELEHCTERAIILSDSNDLSMEDFGILNQKESLRTNEINLNLKEMEIDHIKKALIKHNGNITKSARELGIDRLALYRRLEKYGI